MKYTRYNIKRNKSKNSNFILIFIIILISAAMLGTLLSNLFIKKDKTTKNSMIQNAKETMKEEKIIKKQTPKKQNISDKKDSQFVAIQCGVFKNIENAKVMQGTLKGIGNAFIVSENSLHKVILGIYPIKELDNIVSNLKKRNIEYSKVVLDIKINDVCTAEINEIISANIKILNTLSVGNVKSIKTENLKKWTGKLELAKKDNENYDILVGIKNYVNKLPNEIKSNEVQAGYIYIYTIIKKIK